MRTSGDAYERHSHGRRTSLVFPERQSRMESKIDGEDRAIAKRGTTTDGESEIKDGAKTPVEELRGSRTERQLTPGGSMIFRVFVFALGAAFAAPNIFAQQSSAQAMHTLKPTPKTVAWGYYDAKAAPVLRVKSGDTVEIQTLITNSPKRLEEAGLQPEQVEQSLRDITDQVKDKGPGGPILTGPIYNEGAEIGDVLEVKILAIKLAIPYAYNAFGAGRGYLPDDYPYSKIKIIPLDEKLMVAKFAPGIEIPLHPFFGSMGDAPPESAGRFNSAPPWIMAGKDDNKDTAAGARHDSPARLPRPALSVPQRPPGARAR